MVKSHIPRLCCTAQLAAAFLLSACGTVDVFGQYDLPESPGMAEAPYPKLVDTPSAPPPGTYTDAVPNPIRGIAARVDLMGEADEAAARAQLLQPEVITQAERDRLLQSVEAKRQRLRELEALPTW